MPQQNDIDHTRYQALIAIIDKAKQDGEEDTDVYADAIENLYRPEIIKLRQEQITDEIRQAIATVMSYNWADEQKDFEQMVNEGESAEGEWHIFSRLVTIDNWLSGTSHKASDLIEVSEPETDTETGEPQH